MKNTELIKQLSYDKAFGILTRNALDVEIEKLKSFNCAFIDLNNIKSLNQILGYKKVNELIFNLFHQFKVNHPNCIIGRWFSGDEIMIIHPDIETKIMYLELIGKEMGLTFKRKLYYKVKSLDKLIKKLEDW